MNMVELLKHYGYDTVVIVDDKVNITEDITLQEIIDLDGSKQLEKSLYKFGNPETSLKRSQINDEDLNEFINSIFIDEINLFELVQDLSILDERVIKLQDFNDVTKINNIKGNAVWIIDRYLLNQGITHIGTVFDRYLSRIKDGYMDIIILYTRDLHDIDTYERMKNFIATRVQNQLADKIMFITALSKDRKIEKADIENAIQKLAKVKVFEAYDEENKRSIDEFRKKLYDSQYYKYLVDYDYLSEGKSAYQSFSDILFSTHRNNFYLNNYQRTELISIVNEITNKKYMELDAYTIFQTKLISRLIKEYHQKSRPYDIEKNFLNSIDDLGIGDIYKIDDKYYLIIAQECDLILREDGIRKLKQIKAVEIGISNIAIDHKDFVRENMASVASSGFQQFKKNYTDKSENDYKVEIIDRVIKIVQNNNNEFNFTRDQLLKTKGKRFKNIDVIIYGNEFHTIEILDKNIKYFDGWLLDGALYFRNTDKGFIIFSEKNDIVKLSSKHRINNIKKKLQDLEKEAKDVYNLDFDKYLKIKTGLKISIEEGNVIIPIKRVAKLPYELVLEYIIQVSNDETRQAVDDIISI